ncbi:MAG: group II intron reverse transcriptase domain-containing protein [Bacteroidales bacterium]|nr:group II intron reverse transcriptase domain-containing protein [Bacteroidales bacterium]
MESIIAQLARQEAWEEFLAYRLRKGRFNWHEFDEADRFVAEESYLPLASRVAQGGGLGLPEKLLVNKMGSGKKRVVYRYDEDTMRLLKLLAHLLYKYDDCFAPNCYAFRRGLDAHDALRRVNRSLHGQPMWAYKLDIHDYFNSIPVARLLPMLKELLADDPPLYAFFERMLTERQVVYRGQVMEEDHGIMAGTPTAPFLADVYLNNVDHHFAEAGVLYARYSDDIILFAPDRATLERHQATLLGYLAELGLEVNPDKERVFTPDEPYEFLGFRCQGYDIDIASASVQKMKGKIRRQARSLMRWRSRKDISAEDAMKALIRYFNRKFFESDDPETLTWSRWFFPMLTRTEGMNDIDRYLQQNLRFLATGKHGKANYRVTYEQLKALGYKSLVHEYWEFKKKW